MEGVGVLGMLRYDGDWGCVLVIKVLGELPQKVTACLANHSRDGSSRRLKSANALAAFASLLKRV